MIISLIYNFILVLASIEIISNILWLFSLFEDGGRIADPF